MAGGRGKAPAGFFADSYSLISSGKQLTRGNNVAAYDDNSSTTSRSGSVTSSTNSPDGGANLDFDFPFDQTKGARDPSNLSAGITNLFYWNNMLHDVMMSKGFDEASGNFQYKNITGAGQGGDYVRAESQDGSGRNNANFSTPADGSSGRMQMFLFDNTAANSLVVTGAASAAGSYKFTTVAFGPSLNKKPLAGKLVLVNDGVSADGGDHACATPFVNAADVAGNIAFIQRGGCPHSPTSTPALPMPLPPRCSGPRPTARPALSCLTPWLRIP
ncbi:M36 family metallopeptidase [Hymenobacter humi]|uniref:M36 family metallopeptidase n=1 Tax=Hymenobacter humi TaxID=1411620 RepID=A0ABW2U1N5_9BACT